MIISPAVQPPKVGDPITAKWASDLAAAVNSCANPADRVGEVSTPFGKASPAPDVAMLGKYERFMAFDCRLVNEDGETSVWCAIPSGVAEWVWLGDRPIAPADGQEAGDGDTAFVRVATAGDGPIWIYLGFAGHETEPDEEGKKKVEIDGWRVFATSDASSPPEWAAPGTPLVLLASTKIGSGDESAPSLRFGLVQYHHGSIIAPFLPTEEQEEPYEPPPPCGNPLNDENDYNPLDHGGDNGGSWSGGGGGAGVTRNPLDDPGEGGYTPSCKDNIVNTTAA